MKLRHLPVLFALLLPVAAFAQNAAIQTALDYLSENASVLLLLEADISDVAVVDAYASRRSGTTHVYLRQQHDGIGVVDANLTLNVNDTGNVFHVAGSFEQNIAERVQTSSPVITSIDAAEIIARELGLSSGIFTVVESEGGADQAVILSNETIARLPIPVRLVHRPQPDVIEFSLAWEISLYERDDEHYWYANVDALTGQVLFLHDQVAFDVWAPESAAVVESPQLDVQPHSSFAPPMAPYGFTSRYDVFVLPDESPIHSTPPLPSDGRTQDEDPEDLTASPFGWHDTNGSPGAEDNLSRGNNVDAHKGGIRADGGGALDFSFVANFANSPVTFVDAAITNNFYLTNVLHDILYLYGFDEPAGNFQVNNYGNGGAGNDEVDALVQASGNCNATMGTPSDGSSPTMSMFLCTIPDPDSDSDFDTGVLFHEFAHGLSNRLVGGPNNVSCLNNSEQMGEGWSDWYGILPTIEAGDAGTDSRGIGSYLFGLPANGGTIRPAPYSTNFAVNGFTYQDTRTQVVPHGVGFVWATIIWEVTWELIDAFGWDPDVYNASGTAGNQVMLQLVTEGMKLMPCSPGFVDAKDAIFAAEASIYGNIHFTELCDAFARRGLGDNATQGSTGTNADNTDGFIPCVIPVELDSFGGTANGDNVTLAWSTSSETNNAGFEVQHWTEDTLPESLGFVEGHGTTTEVQSYSFRATGLGVGNHTFRLKQIDFDGAFEYSEQVEVVVGVVGTHVLSEIYPNPFNPQAQFTLAVGSQQNVSITVYDVVGRQVATLHDGILEANESYQFTIDGAGLASGAYFVRIAGETFTNSRRITLLK